MKSNAIVAKITKSLNKKGKLKGSNKKETKMLKQSCVHHKITKRGKIKKTFYISNDGMCTCTLCGARFPANFFKDEEINQICDDFSELNNQNKFIATAANAGNDAQKYFSEVSVMLAKYKKLAKKTKKLAAKQDQIKQKKKKNAFSGSSMYGTWSQRR